MKVISLRCEYQKRPLCIENSHPCLSWQLIFNKRKDKQRAYQILVASSEEMLATDHGDLWDSGKVKSEKHVHVMYNGSELCSHMQCFYKVRIWNLDGESSDWSIVSRFTMGKLKLSDWQGHWISSDKEIFNSSSSCPAILLRKEWTLSKKIKRATAYICGLGLYEFYINGQRIGDSVLDPAFTDYRKRVQYVGYDVTENLIKGFNAVGVILGGGWYNLPTPDNFKLEKAPWRDCPKLLLNIEIEFSDGSCKTLVSNNDWNWSTGPITFNCIRGGETYDARLQKKNWNRVDYDFSSWLPVRIATAPPGELKGQQHPPIRIVKSIAPLSITEPLPNVYVFDFGINLSGWIKFRLKGKKGQKITFKYNELLDENGSVDMQHCSAHTHGRFQTGEYIFSGQGTEIYEPSFTYHGFQYVEVNGLDYKPTLDMITAQWVHTDVQQTGQFSCSNQKINQLQQVITRTHLNNMHGVPTDCPQREKTGWTLDGYISMENSLLNFDTVTFFQKWFYDMLDSQEANGHLPSIVPSGTSHRTGPDGMPAGYSGPWWSGAIVMVPWKLYLWTGDERILSEAYSSMVKYVDYLTKRANDRIIEWGLGDWVEVGSIHPERTPVSLTSTCAYYAVAKILSTAAKRLGKQSDFKRYALLADEIRTAFNERFLDKATGLYATDSQTAQALPIKLGLTEENAIPEVLKRLCENIEYRDGHLSTGIVGTLPLLEVLTDQKRGDLAFGIVTQESCPGWFHMLNQGATTLWETTWGNANSRNHHMFGCVGTWFYQSLAGIRLDQSVPGFKQIAIKPDLGNDLEWVKAQIMCPHGQITSNWQRSAKLFKLYVEIPAGCTALVYMPARQKEDINEGDLPIASIDSVKFIKISDNRAVLEIEQGKYRFTSHYM